MTQIKKRSGVTKLPTGIQGFDYITGGGLPQDRTTLITGGPGTGKTIFALQTLVAGASRGEPGILVTFQESPRHLIENASGFGWNLEGMEKDKLVILDARVRPNILKSIELYLTGMLAGIKLVSGEMGARRIVFDSLDALLLLLGDRTAERHEMFRIRDWLLEAGLTAIITVQGEADDPFVLQRQSFMQFMADCVVDLRHQPRRSGASRSLRVLKYRGSGFVEDEFSVCIGAGGMKVGHPFEVAPAAETVQDHPSDLQEQLDLAKDQFHERLELVARQKQIKKAEREFLASSGAPRQQSVRRPGSTRLVKAANRTAREPSAQTAASPVA